jgi:hypothetical protein
MADRSVQDMRGWARSEDDFFALFRFAAECWLFGTVFMLVLIY